MILCCKSCVAPKRHPGCHDHCEEYIREKEAHNQRKAEIDHGKQISAAIYSARANKVEKAMKKHRSFKR